MIEKYSLSNIKIIGLILLFCILFIVIIYYFRSTLKKHNDIIENFNTNKATIYQGGTLHSGGEGNNKLYNGEISMRKCQVYFVGKNEQSDCDTKYNEDPLSTNCKYEFKDGWNEINTIKNNDNTITVPKKIYNKGYTNIDTIANSEYMTACYKDRVSNGNTKYLYDMQDNVVMYGNGGSVNDATDNNKTLRLNVKEGNKKPMIKSYISKHFGTTGNIENDNLNMISSICSIKYNDVVETDIINFYKFNLIKLNGEWVLKNIKDVELNDDQTAFEGDIDSNFIGSSAYGMYIDRLKQLNDGKVRFTVFKSTSIPNKLVKIYKFKYNYLCGNKGKVLEYNGPIDSEINMGELISNTGYETSIYPFHISYNNSIIKNDFWTTSVPNKDIASYFIDKLMKAKIASMNVYTSDQIHIRLTNEITEIKKSIGGNEGINGTGGANGVRNNFHNLITLDGEIGKTSIIGLNHNGTKLFDFDKGYKLTVVNQDASKFIGKNGREPVVLSNDERMYPPIRNIMSANHPITDEAYGNGNYITSFSSTYHAYKPWTCFNTQDSIGGHWAFPGQRRYIGPNGTFRNTLTDNIVSGYTGDWIKIKFPVAINLTRYALKIRPRFLSRAPENFKIYGSNDETNWVQLTHIEKSVYTNDLYEATIPTSGTYNSFGLVVNKLVGGNGHATGLNFDEWFIYGKEVIQPVKINDDFNYFSFTNSETEPSLVAFYKFDGNYDDSSCNNNHLINNGASLQSQNVIDGQAVDFDNSDFLEFPPSINPYTIWNGRGITFAFWAKISSSSGVWSRLIDFQPNTNTTSGFLIAQRNASNILHFRMGGTSFNVNLTFANNEWRHISFSVSTTGLWTIYINGVNQNVNVIRIIPNLTYNLRYINKSVYSGDGNWDGQMDNFRIYSKVLSQTDVTSLYNNRNTLQSKTYSITFPEDTEAEVLIIGGGGGGGMDMGGGGGAGGFIKLNNQVLNGTYTIKVGKGGDGAPAAGTNGQPTRHQYTINAKNGIDSQFGNNVAIGGGFGGTGPRTHQLKGQANSGGSGGGSSGYQANNDINRAGKGTVGQGNRGGFGRHHHHSGGGGGAGFIGGGSPSVAAGAAKGGDGIYSDITGIGYHWAGGGGGSGYSTTGGNGGLGGGGGGAINNTVGGSGYNNGEPGGGGSTNRWANTPGGNAGEHTGGGGGGGSHYNGNNKGGDGGSGIVIIRYRSPISDIELGKRSEEHVVKNSLKNTSYLDDKNSFILATDRYPHAEIEADRLIKIIVTSMIFLESNRLYNLNINLGIDIGNTKYYLSNFQIKGITVTATNGVYNFKTSNGGFFKISFIAVVLLKVKSTVSFNISSTQGFNYINYLYGGSILNDNIATHNDLFRNVLYRNNTMNSMLSIVNSLHDNHDYWGINKMNTNISDKIIERNKREEQIDKANFDKKNAYDDVIKLIENRNFSGNTPENKPWFNTINPTLTQHVSPSLIFKNYNAVDYITYERDGNTNDTPTINIPRGGVGADFRTNFNKIDDTINTATIYVLR